MSKMTMGAGIAIAGLALLQPGGTAAQAGAAASGAAQGQQLPPGESAGGAAQQSGQQPAAQAPAAQQQGAPANPDLAQRLQHLHQLNHHSLALANLATERGSSERVRTFGQNLAQYHSEVDARVRQLANERGVSLSGGEERLQTARRQYVEMLQGQGHQAGPELDRALLEHLVNDRVAMVDELKRLRDATPGKDAELKGWLDQVENKLEDQRNLARQIRQDARSQREATAR